MRLMLVRALVHQLHDTRRSNGEKSSLPRWGYVPARSSYPAPASELSIEPVWVGMKSGAWPRKRAFEWLAGGCLGATLRSGAGLGGKALTNSHSPFAESRLAVTHVTTKARPVILIT